jgi:tRNA-uridine 2-sulfurtransferase
MEINRDNRNRKVLALMSGGVDSAVAAALLQEQGYQVTGVIMKIWAGESAPGHGLHHGCYGPEEEQDIEDARRVAAKLGLPFHIIDLTAEYQSVVLDYFCREYTAGRTPNPCIRCNQRIKFQALITKARDSGVEFDFIASGHYARIEVDPVSGRYLLKKGLDLTKDQSYFLCFLSQDQLAHLILPLGTCKKVEVRRLAARFGLPVADKPDSQNFISGDYTSIIKTPAVPGPIQDSQGRVLGRHRGLQNYTIGQRKGLGIAAAEQLYVVSLDQGTNTVRVGRRDEIMRAEITATDLNWVSIRELSAPLEVKARIRSAQREAEADLIPEEGDRVRVKFKEPQLAPAPGQAVVFYAGDVVVGGGLIA